MIELKGKFVLILGGGRSGVSAAELAMSKGAEVVLLDTSDSPKCADFLKSRKIPSVTGAAALSWCGHADLAVISPGVPQDSPLASLARKCAERIIGELAFGFSFLDIPVLAVTGTNGKTTTVEMLTHILRICGRDALAAGNIGLPLSEVALSGEKHDVIVTEVSSFQLEFADGFNPMSAALLNITPDHLERHHTPEEYSRLKYSIGSKIVGNGAFILNADLLAECRQINCRKKTFGDTGDCDYSSAGDSLSSAQSGILLKKDELPFSGEHNFANALAAIALAVEYGISPVEAANALKTFHISDHRIQTVLEKNGLVFVDDSKATNVDALCVALRTVSERGLPIVLIAGGLDKQCTLAEAKPLLAKHVSGVFLIGACASRLETEWGNVVPCKMCTSMEDAVFQAANSLNGAPGIVLMSPACASMDMFRDYAQRGDCFKLAAEKYVSTLD